MLFPEESRSETLLIHWSIMEGSYLFLSGMEGLQKILGSGPFFSTIELK